MTGKGWGMRVGNGSMIRTDKHSTCSDNDVPGEFSILVFILTGLGILLSGWTVALVLYNLMSFGDPLSPKILELL